MTEALHQKAGGVGHFEGHFLRDWLFADRLGEHFVIFLLSEVAVVGAVVGLTDGGGMVGGEDAGLGDICGVDDVEAVVAAAEELGLAIADQAGESLERCTVAGAVEPAWAYDGVFDFAAVAVTAPEFFLGDDFGAGVVRPAVDFYTEGGGLVDDEATLVDVTVDADAADVDEAGDAGAFGGVEEVARAVDGAADEIRPGAPISHSGGGVIDALNALAGLVKRGAVGDIALDEFNALGLEPGRVGAFSHEGADGAAALAKLLDDVAA